MSGQDAGSSRRDEILDRAVELIRESGLGGLTMKKVAERVGFTEPAMYRHFPNKQALLLGVADRLGSLFLGPIREIDARSDLSPIERIELMVAHHVGLICDTDGIPILLLAEATASSEDGLLKKMAGFAGTYLQIIAKNAAGLRLPEGSPPVEQAVLPVLGLAAAVALERRMLPGRHLDREEAVRLASFVVRRLLSPEEDRP